MARRVPPRKRWPSGTVPPEASEPDVEIDAGPERCLSCGAISPEEPFCDECLGRSRESELSPLYDDLGCGD